MKKSIFMAAMLLVSAFGFAQPKMNVVGLSGIDVQFKRCVVNGNTCYFDFVLTNETNKIIRVDPTNSRNDMLLALYDDEGNILNGIQGQRGLQGWKWGNAESYSWNGMDIPQGVAIKFRVGFTNVDEYATIFKLLQIPFVDVFTNEPHYIELRNIPIVRRDQ